MSDIEESSRRKPCFLSEIPLALMDGQTWFLSIPRVRTSAKLIDGKPELVETSSFGSDYLDIIDRFNEIQKNEASSFDDFKLISIELAVAVIRQNYDLTFDEAAGLFWFNLDPSETDQEKNVRETLMALAMGNVTKLTELGHDGSKKN